MKKLIPNLVVTAGMLGLALPLYAANANEAMKHAGCAVGLSEDGEATASYFDIAAGMLRESITISPQSPPVVLRSDDGRGAGSVRAFCEAPVRAMLGEERAKKIFLISR